MTDYWEQTHYLLHGTGLQTWEYSPEYAIRSYFYCAAHALVAGAAGLLAGRENKVVVFYCVRCALGAMSAYCEANFAYRVALTCGTEVGLLLWLLLLSSAGMFHAAVAFVPSSFAMVLLTCAWTFWLATGSAEASATRQRRSSTLYIGAIWSVAAATLVGWPFAGIVACGPLAVDALLGLGVVPFFREAATAFLVFVLPSALFDSYMYGRPVLAFLNILLYNSSADKGSGAQLYGVEPWHYYLHNLALNFNAALPAAAVAPPLLLLAHAVTPSGSGSGSGNRSKAARSVSTGRLLLILSGLYLWVGFFSCIPHKEERFMFPVYPLLCFAAALAIATSSRLLCALLPSRLAGRRLRFTLAGGVVALCATISAMRAAGQVIYYGAPLRLYSELHAEMARVTALAPSSSTTTHDSSPPPLVVCTGNEWYRFPSSFFLPRGSILAFVRDGFRGQLPAPYMEPPPRGSRLVPSHFNGLNREEPSRYIPLESCDVLVDLLPISGSNDQAERAAFQRNLFRWRAAPFLDAARSPSWSRALYVPMVSDHSNAYAEYALLLTPRGRKNLAARGVPDV